MSTDSSNTQDIEAISDVLRGEVEAYAGIVRKYEGLIRRLARGYLPNSEDAEDATQEIFIRVYRSLGSFRLDRRFLPWLYSLAVNYLRSTGARISRLRARDAVFESDAHAASDDPAGDAVRAETMAEIRKAVARLDRLSRDVVMLYYFQGLSVKEIAEILALGVENVKTRLFRARRRLGKMLAP